MATITIREGLRFQTDGKGTIYTIKNVKDDTSTICWGENQDCKLTYSNKTIEYFINNKIWIEYDNILN